MFDIDVCAICRETLSTDVHTLTCKHTFHQCCIKKWLKRVPSCPYCRAPAINVVIPGDDSIESDEEDDYDSLTQYSSDDNVSSNSETSDDYYDSDSSNDELSLEEVSRITGEQPDVLEAIFNRNFSPQLWLVFSQWYDLTGLTLQTYMQITGDLYNEEVVNNFVLYQVLSDIFIKQNYEKLNCRLLLQHHRNVMSVDTLSLVEARASTN